MIDLCVLIRYELRKICAKRILWTAFAIVAVISVLILKAVFQLIEKYMMIIMVLFGIAVIMIG